MSVDDETIGDRGDVPEDAEGRVVGELTEGLGLGVACQVYGGIANNDGDSAVYDDWLRGGAEVVLRGDEQGDVFYYVQRC